MLAIGFVFNLFKVSWKNFITSFVGIFENMSLILIESRMALFIIFLSLNQSSS